MFFVYLFNYYFTTCLQNFICLFVIYWCKQNSNLLKNYFFLNSVVVSKKYKSFRLKCYALLQVAYNISFKYAHGTVSTSIS